MRQDMAKVIVERPRWFRRGVVNKPIGRQKRQELSDEAPKRQGMKHGWMNHKELNEHLQPLRRYLYSQVGRAWNDVHRDMCRRIKPSNAVQSHLLDHVRQYVVVNAIWIDGEPHDLKGRKLPNVNSEALFIVHPETGILEALPKLKKYRHVPPPSRYEQVPVSTTRKLVKVHGIWWEVDFQKVSVCRKIGMYSSCYTDLLLSKDPKYAKSFGEVSYWELLSEWGAGMVAVSRRQLNKNEIRRRLKRPASGKKH